MDVVFMIIALKSGMELIDKKDMISTVAAKFLN